MEKASKNSSEGWRSKIQIFLSKNKNLSKKENK